MYKSKKTLSALVSFALTCLIPQAHSVIISDDVFMENGGDLKNIPGTIAKAMEPLRQKSYDTQFQSVGILDTGGVLCTATWIGDAEDSNSVFLLTAAHCTEGTQQKGTAKYKFTDFSGGVTAAGEGIYVTSPYRFSHTPGFGGASTDIALIKLPKIADICDASGKKIPQPVLYDLSDLEGEINKEVWFAGYGLWGTGTGDSNYDYQPAFGTRRAAGASIITDIFENIHGISANFEPHSGRTTSKWARLTSGDSGSAWWQKHQGIWTIIATSNGTGGSYSTGARVSLYTNFIKSVYPQARFLSNASTEATSHVRISTCLKHPH